MTANATPIMMVVWFPLGHARHVSGTVDVKGIVATVGGDGNTAAFLGVLGPRFLQMRLVPCTRVQTRSTKAMVPARVGVTKPDVLSGLVALHTPAVWEPGACQLFSGLWTAWVFSAVPFWWFLDLLYAFW